MDNADLISIVNSLIIDKHITTACTDFISTCYNLFYSTVAEDVTFSLNIDKNYDGNPDEFTIPNIAKNESLGIEPLEGETDPEGVIIGALGQIYYNQLNHKVFFKSTEDEDASGWVFLFQRVTVATEEDTLDNITQLLSNTQEIVTAYYNVFYNDTPMDVTLRLFNNEGVIEEMTIPNRAKSMKVGLSGEGSPEGAVEGTYGTFYVNTITSKVYVKSTPIGNTGWYELISAQELDAHNISPDAHLGFLARIEGDRTKSFNVGNPTSSSHAVNLNYVGALSDLSTVDKSNIVNAINEVNTNLETAKKQASVTSSSAPWCAISGYTDAYGWADLVVNRVDQDIYVDTTTEEYLDNIIEGSWKDDFGSITNFYNWGNKGKVFGAPLGSYFQGWSKKNGEDSTPQTSNVGYAGDPVIHTFDEPLGPGTYIVAYSYSPYSYKYTVNYDSTSTSETVTSAVEGQWSFSSAITVTTSITSIEAYGLASQGEWGIGPIHLIKVIPANTLTSLDKIYFKAGPKYKGISIADINNAVTVKEALDPIDLINYGTSNTSTAFGNGDYYVMYNKGKFNKSPFVYSPLNFDITEEGYAKIKSTVGNMGLVTPCIDLDVTKDISIEFKYTTQYNSRAEDATVFISNPYASVTPNGLIQIVENDGALYGKVGNTESVPETWLLTNVQGNTDYTIKLEISSGVVTSYINGVATEHQPANTLTDDIISGFWYLYASSTNYSLGGIYLDTLKIKYDGHILIDGGPTSPYLYKGSISRSKTNTNNEGLWVNVSKLPMEVINNKNSEVFYDIPLVRVTIANGVITQVKTLPYCNREVDTPTSVAPAYVIESMKTDSYWYRLWSNGFCEQGGVVSITTSGTSITLPKAYKDIYYTITTVPSAGTVTAGASMTTSSFTLYPSANNTCRWGTQGYVANITGFIES